MMEIAGVIPAKGSSSRVPSKNRTEIRGLPLFLWAANNLSRVLPADRIFVDSDDDEILRQTAACGFGTIRRPSALATNATDGNELLLWQASQAPADVYVQHLPPTLFLSESTLLSFLAEIERGADSAFGVRRLHAYQWSGEQPAYDLRRVPNSFDLPELTLESMGLYVVKRAALLAERIRPAGKRAQLELGPIESIDIDYPEDLELARAVANGLPKDSPFIAGVYALAQRYSRIK